MITRSSIVAEARTWQDTPFHWGQATKGVGCDCKGLVFGVARAVGLSVADVETARFAGYGARVDLRLLNQGLAALLERVTVMRPGDVLQLMIGGKPQHLAIFLGDGRMLHTAAGLGRVREVPMGSAWTRAVHRTWTWPGLD